VAVLVLLLVSVFTADIVADTSLPIEARNMAASGESQLPGVFDWWFMVMFIGFPLLSAVFAYFNRIHPLFFWLSILIVILIVIVGASYKEIWGAFISDDLLGAQAARLPMTSLVMGNFGLYSFFIFLIIAFGTFVRLQKGNGGVKY
jgi:hypothetical protein